MRILFHVSINYWSTYACNIHIHTHRLFLWNWFWISGRNCTNSSPRPHICTHALNKTDKLLLNLISFPFLPDRSHVLIIGRFCRKWFIVSVSLRKRKLLCCALVYHICGAEQIWKMILCSAKKVIYFTRTRSLYRSTSSVRHRIKRFGQISE